MEPTGLRVVAASAIGARAVNEDGVGVDSGRRVVIVVDGSGGSPPGEVADRVITAFLAAIADDATLDAALVAGGRALGTGGDPADLVGCAATAVAVRVGRTRATVAHVGDCRAYLVRAGAVRALTRDHRLVEDLVAQGKMTPVEAAASPHRNVITRSLGLGQTPTIDLAEIALEAGDRLVLTTDGVHDRVTDLSSADPDALVDAAFAAGASDDATVAVIHVASVDASLLGGRYRLGARREEDAFGVVFEAEDVVERRAVLVRKLHDGIDADRIRRFTVAARAAQHPGLVRVLDVGPTFAVIEPYTGEDGFALVHRLGRVRPDRACRIVANAARALSAAHAAGVLHAGLTPGHLVISDDDQVIVVGIGDDELVRGPHGAVLGNPGFLAPEVVLAKPLAPTVDVYGLAMVLYYLVTGRAAFEGDTIDELLVQRLQGAPRPPGITPRLDAVIVRALDPDPAKRYPSTEALAVALIA